MRLFLSILLLAINIFSQEIENKINLTPQEKEFLNNINLKVAITTNWQPFSFTEKNQALGISSEYWQLIVNKLDLKTQNLFFDNFNK